MQVGLRHGGTLSMDVPSQSRMGPARGAGPAGGATVEGDGLAWGSGSRDSRHTLHAGRRDGGGRGTRSGPRCEVAGRWPRLRRRSAGSLRGAARQVGEIAAH